MPISIIPDGLPVILLFKDLVGILSSIAFHSVNSNQTLFPPQLGFQGVCAKLLQLCSTLCDPMDCSPPGSSVHGMSQAKILEWVAISFSRVSPPIRDQTLVSCTGRGFFTTKPILKPQLPSPALSLSLSLSLSLHSLASSLASRLP